MDVVDIIRTKRDGESLSDDQITWFVAEYSRGGTIPDEQAAALAMAVYFQGMTSDELAVWNRAMVDSGATLDLSGVGRPTVDKHSTGGVGDKVSLILVPLVAACGAAVPQLSGRGLGHGGGTLDKMEAIAGWRAALTVEEMGAQLRGVGAMIAAATDDLNPADRRLYQLRDVTSTVDSIPLIASSIISKKVAEGTDALVLDVKTGSGAFMVDVDRARELARTMVDLGEDSGVRTVALITGMHTVLGRSAGNALEVSEAIEVLNGHGPEDVVEVTLALAQEMLALVDIDIDPASALDSGKALEVFERMVTAQGGDLSVGLPVAEHRQMITSPASGYLSRLDCRAVGVAAWRLGAGRARKEDPVSATAGVVCLAKPGERVEAGQPLLELHCDDLDRFDAAVSALDEAIEVVDKSPELPSLLIDRIAR
ncbi:MAG: thymidine phosphorylase [Actinomycetota bacterium]|nr:thymidine phosphorylase [Actinomycetota bacterium]